MEYWLEQHPLLIALAVAAVSFIESFALLGIVVPGVVLLFTLAAAAGNVEVPLALLLAMTALGACAGDISSFYIGRWLQHRIDHLAWFRRHRSWLDEGEWFFQRWGWLSVVIGRFVGPIRPVVPLVAGTLNMPARLFIALNLATVLIWAPLYILPGYLTGELALLLETRTLADRALAVTALTAAGVLVALLTLYHHLRPEHPRTRRWLPWLGRLEAAFPFSTLLLTVASGGGLVALILLKPLVWDWVLAAQVPQWRETPVDGFFLGLTLLGDAGALMITGGMIVGWLLLKGYNWLALHLVVAIPMAYWGTFELKDVFDVARPDWVAEQPPGSAFPSGHAAGFTLYIGLLAALVNENRPPMRRWQLYLPAGVLILLMAFSRVWLGVHWLSDAIGGVLIAVLFAALVWASHSHFADKPFRLRGTGPFWLLIGLTFAAYWILAWPEAQLDYRLQSPLPPRPGLELDGRTGQVAQYVLQQPTTFHEVVFRQQVALHGGLKRQPHH